MKKESILVLFVLVLMVVPVMAERLDIEVKNNYGPGDVVNFKIMLYDSENSLIEGDVHFVIQNYYSEIVTEGIVSSGESVTYQLPVDAMRGPWKIGASYDSIETNRLFNVGELEKIDIKIEGDTLVLKNIGNVLYDRQLLIYIGEQDQTANVRLEVGETKLIKLTAPVDTYTVRITDGTEESSKEFSNVALTGNVIGLERVIPGSFWEKYPMVALFLAIIVVLVVIVTGARVKDKYYNHF